MRSANNDGFAVDLPVDGGAWSQTEALADLGGY